MSLGTWAYLRFITHGVTERFVTRGSDGAVCVAVMAASSIANIVKSSLGPVGLDKMLVDDIGVSPRRAQHRRLVHTSLCNTHAVAVKK